MTVDGDLTTMVSLVQPQGFDPYGNVVQGADGNLYGTTSQGGLFDRGTIYRVTVKAPVSPPQISTHANFGFKDGQFGFDIIGTNGATVVIHGSSNLIHWIPISTNILGSAPLQFSDPQSELPKRYYRLSIP